MHLMRIYIYFLTNHPHCICPYLFYGVYKGENESVCFSRHLFFYAEATLKIKCSRAVT